MEQREQSHRGCKCAVDRIIAGFLRWVRHLHGQALQ